MFSRQVQVPDGIGLAVRALVALDGGRHGDLAAVHAGHVALLVVDRKGHALAEVFLAVGVEDADRFQVVEDFAFRRDRVAKGLVRVADSERLVKRRLVESSAFQVRPAFRILEKGLVVELGDLVEQRLLLRRAGLRLRRRKIGSGLGQAAVLLGQLADGLAGGQAVVEDEEVYAASALAASETPPERFRRRNDQAGFRVLVKGTVDFPFVVPVPLRLVAARADQSQQINGRFERLQVHGVFERSGGDHGPPSEKGVKTKKIILDLASVMLVYSQYAKNNTSLFFAAVRRA